MTIPAQISASRALARDERYAGPVDVAGLGRLSDLSPENVEADLRIWTGASRQGWIEGRITGTLQLECRVCSEPFAWPLDAPVKLALAMSEEQEEKLMADGEPLLVRDDSLMLHEIVEDEVLLALPMMPRCPACENARPPSDEPRDEVARPGPLAALKGLSLKKGVTPARRK